MTAWRSHSQASSLYCTSWLRAEVPRAPRFRSSSPLTLRQGCLRALLENNFHPPTPFRVGWLEMGFCQCPGMGPKWVKKVGFWATLIHFCTQQSTFAPNNRTHLRSLTKTHLRPTFSGHKLFLKRALRQPWPSISGDEVLRFQQQDEELSMP